MSGVLCFAVLMPMWAPVMAQNSHPAPAFERFRRLSPKDRKRALQGLPPDRARAVERRIERLDKMPADQRDRLEDQYNWFSRLPSDRKQAMREAFKRFRELPPDRQDTIRDAFQALRDVPEAERRIRLGEFNPAERQLLEEMVAAVTGRTP